LSVEALSVGRLQTNCYVLACDGDAAVIDPADEPERIMARVAATKATLRLLICTHAHVDHIGALAALQQATGAPALLHADDLPLLLGGGLVPAGSSLQLAEPLLSLAAMRAEAPASRQPLADGQAVSIGSATLVVLHTPGHTAGSISLYCAAEGVLFSGDTLFHLGVGRADLPTGNGRQLLESIKRRLFTLPDATVVYPGHGLSTTVGLEKRRNPFVRAVP